MRVKMLTTVAGTDHENRVYVHEAGEEYDLPTALAREYLSTPEASPRAEPVATKPQEKSEKRTSRAVAGAETR